MESTSKPRRRFRWLQRFSIFSLLLLMACVAGYLSGYRWGVEQRANEVTFRKVYYVADLVTPSPDKFSAASAAEFDPLINLITSTVAIDEWQTGEGEVRPFPQNLSLVVAATGSTHNQIADLLKQLRELRTQLPEDYLTNVREALNRKRKSPAIIKLFTDLGPQDRKRFQDFFATALKGLSREHGQPSLTTDAGDKQFPEWAAGQKIAVWDRRGGKLYLALQDCRPRGEALIAGWWEESFGTLQPLRLAPQMLASAERETKTGN